MAKPYSRVLSKDQYLNSFVDFYNQTLGTGISSSVAIDPTEDQQEKINAPSIYGGEGGDSSVFYSPEYFFGDKGVMNPTTPQNVMSRSAQDIKKDRSDNYFKDFQIKEQANKFFSSDAGQLISGAELIFGLDGALTGAYAIGKGVSELSKRARDRAAYDVYAAGGNAGSAWEVNGQSVVRRPGSKYYIGTVTEDPAALYKAEQLSYGYIPGTMVETQGEDGSWTRSGFDGVLDAATAQRLGGNYDAYGYWHSANGTSRYGPADGGKAAYDKAFGAGASARDGFEAVKNFMSNWRSNSTKGYFEAVDRMDPDRYAKDLANTRNIFNTGSGGSGDNSDPDPRPDYSITQEYRDNYFVGSEDDEFGNLPYEPDPTPPPTSTPTSTPTSSSGGGGGGSDNDNSNSPSSSNDNPHGGWSEPGYDHQGWSDDPLQ